MKISVKTISKLSYLLAGLLMVDYASAQNFTQQQQPFKGTVGKTLADSKESWNTNIKAPKGAPNVVWILLDDVGYGASSTFGGVISTPNFDSLAGKGLRYTNFHTAGICAPTRSALLTGRNHHYVHMEDLRIPHCRQAFQAMMAAFHRTKAPLLRSCARTGTIPLL